MGSDSESPDNRNEGDRYERGNQQCGEKDHTLCETFREHLLTFSYVLLIQTGSGPGRVHHCRSELTLTLVRR